MTVKVEFLVSTLYTHTTQWIQWKNSSSTNLSFFKPQKISFLWKISWFPRMRIEWFYNQKPWNGGLLLAVELVGESKPGLRSGIGVTTGHVKPRRCCIPCSFIISLLSESIVMWHATQKIYWNILILNINCFLFFGRMKYLKENIVMTTENICIKF